MIAKHLASAGAMVAMGARRTDRLVELKRQIEADGGVAIAVTCDVTDRSQVGHITCVRNCVLCCFGMTFFFLRLLSLPAFLEWVSFRGRVRANI